MQIYYLQFFFIYFYYIIKLNFLANYFNFYYWQFATKYYILVHII